MRRGRIACAGRRSGGPRLIVAGLAASWLLAGCAVVGPIEERVPKASHESQVFALPSPIYALPFPMLTIRPDRKPAEPPSADLLDDSYADFFGIIHIHTRYSDGAGAFLVENGKLAAPISTLRFTQSLLEALNSVVGISKERQLVADPSQDFGCAVMPTIKLAKFRFTGRSGR